MIPPDASTPRPPRPTQDLRVNDCVRVTYAQGSQGSQDSQDSQDQGLYIAEEVTGVQASQHADECPSQ